MSLQDVFATLSEGERNLQLGYDTCDPLHKAFASKRAVHAGLSGRPLPKDEAQVVWADIMNTAPPQGVMQTAYIHIPFCQTKCTYCGFYQHATNQEVEDHYVDNLLKEMQMASDKPRLKDGLIHSVFIGGGTPTSLSAENAARLLQGIQKYLPLANDYELTLEGRIHDVVPEKMEAWMANGVNRMSLGVQSFHTHVRRQLGRLDTQETIMERLAALKAYQQCSIIVDLIYGLPDQTMDVWLEDLKLLVESPADGMDLYQLNVFENSDLNSLIQRGKVSRAATTMEQADMYQAAIDFVGKRDFTRLSVCHWSRAPRERSLYNTMAKAGYPMFPFGCGAGGNLNGYMTMLHRVLPPYEAMIDAGQKPFMVLMKQSPVQAFSDYIIAQLERCVFDFAGLVEKDERLKDLQYILDLWVERGLMTYNGVMYRLTVAGEFWHVNLTQTLLEAMQYILTGDQTILHEKVAAQDGPPKGHPDISKMGSDAKHPTGVMKMGGHPAGVPKTGGHPAGIPKTGGHPAGIPKDGEVRCPGAQLMSTGGHPASVAKSGHPGGIPKGEGHPAGIPKHGHHHGKHGEHGHHHGEHGHPGHKTTTHGVVGHGPYKEND